VDGAHINEAERERDGEEARDIDSLTPTRGKPMLSPSEIAKVGNPPQQETTG
jgi:hypothetical protein